MRTGLSYVEALAAIDAAVAPLDAETVPLAAAAGRVAARDQVSPRALPGFRNAAMDGFAVAGAALPTTGECRFRIRATVLAGATTVPKLAPGEVAAITTGALMPGGADTVVVSERARVDGDGVWLPAAATGANVRAADDDCAEGSLLWRAGEVLGPAHLALAAALGDTALVVARRPRVAILATGDELRPAGDVLQPGQRHDSNGELLAAMATESGCQVVARARVGDDPGRLRAILAELMTGADLVVSSGGVSAGSADHMPGVVASLAQVLFWKVRIKPGMPVLAARAAPALLFALPGNPVSAGVTFQVLVRPAVRKLTGQQADSGLDAVARLASDWPKRHARLEFLRVQLSLDSGGQLLAMPLARQGSGILSGLVAADALAVLPEDPRQYRAGDTVRVLGWSGVWRQGLAPDVARGAADASTAGLPA